MAFDKVRIRFRKDGDRRFVSHHDLMRAFERMLRRAGLPFRSTEGFHPQPRVVFSLSLPLGMSGIDEVVEIEWLEPVEPSEVLERLTRCAPEGLHFFNARRIDLKQAAKPRRALYRMPIPANEAEEVTARCEKLLANAELWIDRERPRPRQVNVRPYIHALYVEDGQLYMDVWISQEGGVRADALAKVLDLNHLLDAGAVIERAKLDIEDEIDPAAAALRPALPRREDRGTLERPLPRPLTPPPLLVAVPGSHWGASPNGPIVE
ncbi:MAG: TIGR03936 family radical SAM-associated protein [Planctomycetes bacterium]|nr:TIGR03936 family radical SAM-associated protein [Planctomycetota bacterium]